MKRLSIIRMLIFIGLSVSIISCNDGQTNEQTSEEIAKEAARRDSAALHVAIYPCEVCLPFYYAEETEIYDSMNVDIRFLHLNSMEDCDTALIFKRAEVASSDIARLIAMQKHGHKGIAIATMNGSLRMLAAKEKNIKDIKQLKERLLAIARHSETDYLSDVLTEQRELDHLDIFRTQFNQHSIRYDMLNGGLVDAAFLDEPWATIAIENGATSMWKRDKNAYSWNVLAVNPASVNDSARINQINKLIEGYNRAVQSINRCDNMLKYDSILVHTYGIAKAAIDTIESLKDNVKNFKPLAPVNDSILNVATQWLIKRQWINSEQNTQNLISNKFIPKK